MATLTTRLVETLKPGPTRREIPDAHLPGLYLIVQPSGAMSWAVRYRHYGKTRKLTIGRYPAIDLKSARDLARKALRTVAEGRDPGRERAALSDTIEGLAAQFVERHCAELVIAHTRPGLRRIYDLHSFEDEKRHALDLWAARLRSIVKPPAANVIPLMRVPNG